MVNRKVNQSLVPRLEYRKRVRKIVEDFWYKPHTTGKWLNIGCGPDIRESSDLTNKQWVNYDKYPSYKIVKPLDLTKIPWNIPDESADRILAEQVMEHLPHYTNKGNDAAIAFLCEVSRILKPGGRIIIGVPDAWGKDPWSNITHYRAYNERTIVSALAPPIPGEEVANHQQGFPKLKQVKIVLAKRWKLFGIDTSYHFPKYFKWEPNIGNRWMMYVLLEKVK